MHDSFKKTIADRLRKKYGSFCVEEEVPYYRDDGTLAGIADIEVTLPNSLRYYEIKCSSRQKGHAHVQGHSWLNKHDYLRNDACLHFIYIAKKGPGGKPDLEHITRLLRKK